MLEEVQHRLRSLAWMAGVLVRHARRLVRDAARTARVLEDKGRARVQRRARA